MNFTNFYFEFVSEKIREIEFKPTIIRVICEIRGRRINLLKFVINEILSIMEIKNLSKYSNAEKIVLAEQLWDSVSKEELQISSDVEKELDIRLKNLEEGKTELYTWDEIKAHLKSIR